MSFIEKLCLLPRVSFIGGSYILYALVVNEYVPFERMYTFLLDCLRHMMTMATVRMMMTAANTAMRAMIEMRSGVRGLPESPVSSGVSSVTTAIAVWRRETERERRWRKERGRKVHRGLHKTREEARNNVESTIMGNVRKRYFCSVQTSWRY